MNRSQNSVVRSLITRRQPVSAKELELELGLGHRTILRLIEDLILWGYVGTVGKGKSIKYIPLPAGYLNFEIDASRDLADERLNFESIGLNQDIFQWLTSYKFSDEEITRLENARTLYSNKLMQTTSKLKQKELERLVVEFSWKSSQFEGDTYTLLETENLLRSNIKSPNKSVFDAQIILNHKSALEFIFANPGYFKELSVKKIQEIHQLLTHKLGVNTGFRKGGVGISGSLYRPLDNVLQIEEKITQTCNLINQTDDCFLKAMLASLLISYIQPFEDGNKRTSRLLANAILFDYGLPLLSYRKTTPNDYRDAVVAFYEYNSLVWFKRIFIEQIEFCAQYYF